MLDDAGYAQADTVGGPIHTPTLSRIADSGVRYNDFNTTALCSSKRASLLTGRNQHRVGSGTITELASDFHGYTAIGRALCWERWRSSLSLGGATVYFKKKKQKT